jgi:hypothetical protein
MTRRTIIITIADERYFSLVCGCIQSIRDKPQAADVALAFLDVGCTAEQREWLRPRVDFLREPDWEFDFPGREQTPKYICGVLARPFLRKYFPGFETYLWIDGDAWVQDWCAVQLLCEGAIRRRGLAIVPEIDRASKWQYGGLPEYWKLAHGWYSAVFGAEIAQKLCSFPMLNAGVFALHCDAPHWSCWETVIAQAIRNGCRFMTDQLALNYATYLQGMFGHTELLPAWCNWTCHLGFPRWHPVRQQLVEPYLPHTPIGILHLTTRDKSPVRRLVTTDNQQVEIQVSYPAGPAASLTSECSGNV